MRIDRSEVSMATSSSRAPSTLAPAGTSGSGAVSFAAPPSPDRLGRETVASEAAPGVSAAPGAEGDGAASWPGDEGAGGFVGGCGGKRIHQTIRNPAERTTNRTVFL